MNTCQREYKFLTTNEGSNGKTTAEEAIMRPQGFKELETYF